MLLRFSEQASLPAMGPEINWFYLLEMKHNDAAITISITVISVVPSTQHSTVHSIGQKGATTAGTSEAASLTLYCGLQC